MESLTIKSELVAFEKGDGTDLYLERLKADKL
jgi:hypothetical protein